MARRNQRWNVKFLRKAGRALTRLSIRFIPLGIVIAVLSFVFFGVRQMVEADPYFHVERVSVFPSGLLNSSEYRFLGDETRARSLLEIDLKKISRNLEKNPKIKQANVVRSLPDRINIFLKARLPFVQVQLKPDGPYYSVAEDQLILSKQKSRQPDLMVLEDFSAQKKVYSAGLLYQNIHFHELSPLFESLKHDAILSTETVSRVKMDQLGNLSLILNDGIELKIGQGLALSEGARLVLGSVLRSNERNQILYVDLRYRDMIVKKKTQ